MICGLAPPSARAPLLRRLNDGHAHLQLNSRLAMSNPHPVLIVVEDDAPLLASLAWSFEVEGFQVHPYRDAELLLSRVEALPEQGCMIIDYRLPGVDGLELVEQLRARGCLLPALLITTPAPAIVRQARAAGILLVEKPLVSSLLLHQVRSLLN